MKKVLIGIFLLVMVVPFGISEEAKDIGTVCDIKVENCVVNEATSGGAGNVVAMNSKGIIEQTKCLQPKAALHFIQNKGCTRIYESQKCADKNFVEVQC